MYNLFLDDFRSPLDCHYMPNPRFYFTTEWVIVRNFDEFCNIIQKNYAEGKLPSIISYDHDLGDSHYGEIITEDQYEATYVGLKEKTGLDCAKWFSDFCLENSIKLPDYLVHSMNTVGAKNISSYLENFKKFQNSEKL